MRESTSFCFSLDLEARLSTSMPELSSRTWSRTCSSRSCSKKLMGGKSTGCARSFASTSTKRERVVRPTAASERRYATPSPRTSLTASLSSNPNQVFAVPTTAWSSSTAVTAGASLVQLHSRARYDASAPPPRPMTTELLGPLLARNCDATMAWWNSKARYRWSIAGVDASAAESVWSTASWPCAFAFWPFLAPLLLPLPLPLPTFCFFLSDSSSLASDCTALGLSRNTRRRWVTRRPEISSSTRTSSTDKSPLSSELIVAFTSREPRSESTVRYGMASSVFISGGANESMEVDSSAWMASIDSNVWPRPIPTTISRPIPLLVAILSWPSSLENIHSCSRPCGTRKTPHRSFCRARERHESITLTRYRGPPSAVGSAVSPLPYSANLAHRPRRPPVRTRCFMW
mmetsp:Transcript_694/g.2109  ORF Transcript_694/g.2109 Transcript_694/m.2109 type:complete len:403 (+) Transcript_694:2062-3270(+)